MSQTQRFIFSAFLLIPLLTSSFSHADFLAGAAITDVTPKKFPVLVNGSMLGHFAEKVDNPVSARAIAFSDGNEKIVIVTVDSCMMPRPLLDEVKKIASEKTGIPISHFLISATHTHTAPSCMGALGTPADPAYVIFLKKKLVDAIIAPLKNLEPARIGYGKIDAGDFTALRRWVILPESVRDDPFGNPTVRANMHAGAKWETVAGETGPKDPDLSIISIQSKDGRPIAVYGNFSMHYFGDRPIGADYFGRFSNGLRERIQPKTPEGKPDFVGVMSHGCSGDIYRADYTKTAEERAANKPTIDEYAGAMADLALKAYNKIEYQVPKSISMAETRMKLNYRVPNKQRLEWANRVLSDREEGKKKNIQEVYANEQVILDERKDTEIVVQGIRLGDDIGIATTSNETYAITGLKIKAASPLSNTIVVELANGGDGYIPPPEQHLLGGYNTWAARSAGLEVQAEPKITEAAIQLLEKVSGKSRAEKNTTGGNAVTKIKELKPAAYWRMDEFSGPRAQDSSENHLDAIYEPQVLFYLEGPRADLFAKNGAQNRAPHFAGNRLQSRIPEMKQDYSISLWLWNGMPNSGRDETGWIFSRGRNFTLGDEGDHLGIGGISGNAGNLVFFHGDEETERIAGKTVIERWTWTHLVFVRKGNTVSAYLNGKKEFEATSKATLPADLKDIFFGGRCDNLNNFEGRLDEIAVFARALNAAEITKLNEANK